MLGCRAQLDGCAHRADAPHLQEALLRPERAEGSVGGGERCRRAAQAGQDPGEARPRGAGARRRGDRGSAPPLRGGAVEGAADASGKEGDPGVADGGGVRSARPARPLGAGGDEAPMGVDGGHGASIAGEEVLQARVHGGGAERPHLHGGVVDPARADQVRAERAPRQGLPRSGRPALRASERGRGNRRARGAGEEGGGEARSGSPAVARGGRGAAVGRAEPLEGQGPHPARRRGGGPRERRQGVEGGAQGGGVARARGEEAGGGEAGEGEHLQRGRVPRAPQRPARREGGARRERPLVPRSGRGAQRAAGDPEEARGRVALAGRAIFRSRVVTGAISLRGSSQRSLCGVLYKYQKSPPRPSL